MSNNPESMWTSLEIAKFVVSIASPLAIVILGFMFNSRLRSFEAARRVEENERREAVEEHRREVERIYVPHVEFSIDCQFYGPRDGKLLTYLVLTATNHGHVEHRFKSIKLRVRGIRGDSPFEIWKGRGPRVAFPHKLFASELVPPDWNFIIIEPGVAQDITFSASIDSVYSHILVHAEFEYDKYTPHNTEALFEVSKGVV